jgi:hypothetical protein
MATRVVTAKHMAEALLDNTKALRSNLEKYVHFVPISYGVIAELIEIFDDTYKQNMYTQVYNYFSSKYPLSDSVDIDNLSAIITNNKVQRLSGKTSIGVYKNGTLVGVLASSFANASSLVVNAIQKLTGVNLAVGHVVGDIEVISSKVVGGHVWIKNNLSFRSPLSMKLAIIQELYGLAEHIKEEQYDSIIDWYFSPLEGTTRFVPKGNFSVLKEALTATGPKVFAGDLGKDSALEKGISKTAIVSGLKTFYNSHFKKIRETVQSKGEALSVQVTNSINSAISSLAKEHQAYLDRVIDQAVITKEFKKDLAELKIIFVLPQTQTFNSKYLAPIEYRISKQAMAFAENKALELRSSPSLKDFIEDTIIDEIIGVKKTRRLRQSISAVDGKATPISNTKLSISGTKQLITKRQTTRKAPLRNAVGQFTSVTSIQALMQAALYDTIKKNMVSPALNFRTGRFAESVKLQKISADRNGSLIAFLTYMKYPYATFEPGFGQGSTERNPKLLIDRSVREIALKLVTARMKTIII